MIVPIQVRVAAMQFWITGLGFGVFCLPAIRNLLIGRDIPYIMGFPAYGKGPFERIGIPTTVPLLVGFLLVCAGMMCVCALRVDHQQGISCDSVKNQRDRRNYIR